MIITRHLIRLSFKGIYRLNIWETLHIRRKNIMMVASTTLLLYETWSKITRSQEMIDKSLIAFYNDTMVWQYHIRNHKKILSFWNWHSWFILFFMHVSYCCVIIDLCSGISLWKIKPFDFFINQSWFKKGTVAISFSSHLKIFVNLITRIKISTWEVRKNFLLRFNGACLIFA